MEPMIPRIDPDPTKPLQLWTRIPNRDALPLELLHSDLSADPTCRSRQLETIDRELEDGHFPDGLQALSNDEVVGETARCFTRQVTAGGLAGALLGGSTGAYLTCGAAGAMVCGLAGMLLGLVRTCWSLHGVVETQLDNQRRRRSFYIHPHLYQRSPQEVRSVLYARDELGEHIRPHSMQNSLDVSVPRDRMLTASQRHELVALASARRLVADFGETSRYGHPVATVVDSVLAGRLLTAGAATPVRLYLVTTMDSWEAPHHLIVRGRSHRGSIRLGDCYAWTETRCSYHLARLERPADLDSIPAGGGVPPKLVGLYRDQEQYSETTGHVVTQWLQSSEHRSPVDGWLSLHLFKREASGQQVTRRE
ncbi:MAG: hypothetical protein ACYCW6_03530 [Candidatus Xenobia bacterium]